MQVNTLLKGPATLDQLERQQQAKPNRPISTQPH
uniref:Uncharacterized protein n=1 Tax=Anguilla anguilla TaxID=7936 RepID=A0A0E9SNB7_ANGAN